MTLFIRVFTAAWLFMAHPFYVSVTEINHNAADKTLEISCKIFIDDFEKTLKTVYKTPFDLTNNQAAASRQITDYLQKHLRITVDGRPVSFSFIGTEKEDVAIWCHFQADNLPSASRISITNNILHELSDKQINILHVTVGGTRKSQKLSFPDTKAEFNY